MLTFAHKTIIVSSNAGLVMRKQREYIINMPKRTTNTDIPTNYHIITTTTPTLMCI